MTPDVVEVHHSCTLDLLDLRWPLPRDGKPMPEWIQRHPGVQCMLRKLGEHVAHLAVPYAEITHDGIMVEASILVAMRPGEVENYARRAIRDAENVVAAIRQESRNWAAVERENIRRERDRLAADLRELWESFHGYDECAGRR